MKRIALIMPGGVAHYERDLHIPALYDLVSRLSNYFDITVYSLITFGKGPDTSRCGNAVVKLISARHQDHWTTKAFLMSREFSRDHRRQKFDIVHGMLGVTTELTAILLSKYYKIPSVISLLGGETANIEHLRYGAFNSKRLATLVRYICRNADVLTVLTNFQALELDSKHIKRKYLQVIPFGVDMQLFNSNGKKLPQQPYRFLHVSNIIPLKDQEMLLRAFKVITERYDARLKIIGTDHSQGKLAARIRELRLDDKVEVLGYLPHHELAEHFRWADMLLHTSLHEAQGVVIAEAAATSTLLAGTNVGLIADFREDKAIAVATGDYQALASKVSEMLSSSSQMTAMRDRALAWAQENDIEKTVASYRRIYDEVRRR